MVTASEMGKKGGGAKSEAKTAAARKNASKPRGRWVTAIAYEIANVEDCLMFGSVVVRGKPPSEALANHEWVCKKLRDEGCGLQDVKDFAFMQLATTSMAL